MDTSRLTRRAALGLALAASTAAAGPLAIADAKRRPRLASIPSLTLGIQAQEVPAANGKAAGLRLSLAFSESGEGVEWSITHLYVDGVQILDIEPSYFGVQGVETLPTVVRPVTATGTVSVRLAYTRGSAPEVFLPTTNVTVLPAEARPPKPLR